MNISYLKRFIMVLCTLTIMLNVTFSVKANQSSKDVQISIPTTILVNGAEKNVKIVTWEEYHNDNSGDFLVVLSGPALPRLSSLAPEIEHFGIIEKIIAKVGNELFGYILGKGFEYVWNNILTPTQAFQAYQVIISTFSTSWLFASFAVGVSVIILTVNVYAPDRVTNNQQCVWSGIDQYSGVWNCIYRANELKKL